ncbi:MAG: glycosyltransferase [Lachnospiraceae bacterium]|nr:glycosyltransferase [Lachnospiraceae bacterium]
MKSVLCIDWGAHGIGDAAEALARLGYEPVIAGIAWDDIVNNPGFPEAVKELLAPVTGERPAFVFTHNFFPSISDVCEKQGIPYLSLVFDSPHMTLTSRAVTNRVNHIWLFDRGLQEVLTRKGFPGLHHTVLPASSRMAEQAKRGGLTGESAQTAQDTAESRRYAHEVCFLGSLYQRDYIFYDQIGYLPPALKGYLDGVIEAQQQLFGYDMIGDEKILPEEKIREMAQYVHFDIGKDYLPDPSLLLRDMLRKKVTSLERFRVLEYLGKRFPVDVYTTPDAALPEGLRNLGYADYGTQMPQVFYSSKININLTLRTIRTGIPLRAMDILASGGFLISDWRPELAECFRDGEEVVLVHTKEEMADRIAWYLNHDAEREAIAANGQKAALERYSTDRVFGRMIEEMEI